MDFLTVATRWAPFMSDNWIKLVPKNHQLVPEAANQERAMAYLRRIGNVGEIELDVWDSVRFVDCGSNFESIHCSHCNAAVDMGWFADRMGEDYCNGFQLSPFKMPCCQKQSSLNELTFEWPQAFGRFVLGIMNPEIGLL